MIEPICATAPVWSGPEGEPYVHVNFLLALLRSLATVAEVSDDPATFAAAITIEADALELLARERTATAAH